MSSCSLKPDQVGDLYDTEFYYYVNLSRRLIENLKDKQDRRICVNWIRKLCRLENSDVQVKVCRNSFFKYLLQNLRNFDFASKNWPTEYEYRFEGEKLGRPRVDPRFEQGNVVLPRMNPTIRHDPLSYPRMGLCWTRDISEKSLWGTSLTKIYNNNRYVSKTLKTIQNLKWLESQLWKEARHERPKSKCQEAVISRWSMDKRTYIAVKPLPGQGALVYMAVAKDPKMGWDNEVQK